MDKIKTIQRNRLEQEFNIKDNQAKFLPFKEWVLWESQKTFFFAWLLSDESLEERYSAE